MDIMLSASHQRTAKPDLKSIFHGEWQPAIAWYALGALCASALHLLFFDKYFGKFIGRPWSKPYSIVYELRFYLTAVLLVALVVGGKQLARLGARAYKSWRAGIIRGLRLPSFICGTSLLLLQVWQAKNVATLDLCILAASIALAIGNLIWFPMNRVIYADGDVRVPEHLSKLGGKEPKLSPDPIDKWEQDLLHRAPLVDALSVSSLVQRMPVIALLGPFGSGKTSILRLLQRHLQNKAIVVSFSTWLPGSADTLAVRLLHDISTECRRKYVVPRIGRSSRKVARTLLKSVSPIKNAADLLEESTQADDLRELSSIIDTIPMRVLVLLDEVDRMQPDEALVLLKVLRGISDSQNLSLVYASDRSRLEQIVTGSYKEDSHNYFEKFFPLSISVPPLENEQLRDLAIHQLRDALTSQGWFTFDNDAELFMHDIDGGWPMCFQSFIATPRAALLLANSVRMAGMRLRDDVNPFDLTLIELLRTFEPQAYEVIWKNRDTLTGGRAAAGKIRFALLRDEDHLRMIRDIATDLERVTESNDRRAAVKHIVSLLFPDIASLRENNPFPRVQTSRNEITVGRASDSELFAAFFQYVLPESTHSLRTTRQFLKKISEETDPGQKRQLFERQFRSLEKGSAVRADFFVQVSHIIPTLDIGTAKQLALSCSFLAENLTYDMGYISAAEAGTALSILIKATLRIDQPLRSAFLQTCLLAATDDTFALRILNSLSKPGRDFNLEVKFADLYGVFVQRMRQRYGPQIDASSIELSTSDPQAFNVWGFKTFDGVVIDPEDRKIQAGFWLRYIGRSRRRLAYAFDKYFMPVGIYNVDARLVVETKIPAGMLKTLYETLPDEELSDTEKKTMDRLKRFLDGDFSGGISVDEWSETSTNIAAS